MLDAKNVTDAKLRPEEKQSFDDTVLYRQPDGAVLVSRVPVLSSVDPYAVRWGTIGNTTVVYIGAWTEDLWWSAMFNLFAAIQLKDWQRQIIQRTPGDAKQGEKESSHQLTPQITEVLNGSFDNLQTTLTMERRENIRNSFVALLAYIATLMEFIHATYQTVDKFKAQWGKQWADATALLEKTVGENSGDILPADLISPFKNFPTHPPHILVTLSQKATLNMTGANSSGTTVVPDLSSMPLLQQPMLKSEADAALPVKKRKTSGSKKK